jgi:hypothetical protein
MKSDVFDTPLNVVNIGLERFGEALNDQGIDHIHVQWKPLAGGDVELAQRMQALVDPDNPLSVLRDNANREAVSRLKNAQPVWIDVVPAHQALGISKTTLLHAGPPIAWEAMCGPMRGAVIAALKYEGLAQNDDEALALADSGQIQFEPCHHYGAVGPMTGVTSASMPLIVVENKALGNRAYSTLNEGAGDVLRFGACSDNTVRRLKWIETELGPAMRQVVLKAGGINLKSIIAQALNMGDELHMRNGASTALFIKTILPWLTETCTDPVKLNAISRFLTTNNDQFFLNFAMASAKCSADAAHGLAGSTMVTAMARNGVNIGIRVSGLGNTWFTAPAAEVNGLYFPGYTIADANRDIGDSAIMETLGIGGFAIAAGPAIVRILGSGTVQDALRNTLDMYDITLSESDAFTIPNLDFRGSPTGIDVIKVLQSGLTPLINTAIASKNAGVGMIGAGIAQAPLLLFTQAARAYLAHDNHKGELES